MPSREAKTQQAGNACVGRRPIAALSHFFHRLYLLLAGSLQLYHTTKRKIAVHPCRARMSATKPTTSSLASLTLPSRQPPPSSGPSDGCTSGSVVMDTDNWATTVSVCLGIPGSLSLTSAGGTQHRRQQTTHTGWVRG